MPGPAPIPTEHLIARGNPHAKSRQKTEAIDSVAAPLPPDFLSKKAREHWDYIVPRLLTRRTLTEADLGFLVTMCIEYAEYTDAYIELQRLKKRRRSYKGHLIDHPRVRMKGANERYTRAAIQFGLSPSAKSRVQAGPRENPKEQKKSGPPTLRIAG